MDYISSLSKNLQQLIYLEIYKYRMIFVWHELICLMMWVDADKRFDNVEGWYLFIREHEEPLGCYQKLFQFDISERLSCGFCCGGCVFIRQRFSKIGKISEDSRHGDVLLPARYWYSFVQ